MDGNKQPISDELHIVRYGNGIKLLPSGDSTDRTSPTIGSLKQLPFSFYFLNLDGTTQNINDEGARVCGFESASSAIGKSLLDVSQKESATHLISNCRTVINSNTISIFEEENLRNDNVTLQFLSIKSPWYNNDNKIIGILGCSIVLGKHSLANSLSEIRKLGLLGSNNLPANPPPLLNNLKINNIYLSTRELECLRLTIKGYTAKRIARELGISHRTVEEYLCNIRIKTGAGSKAELIEMTLENFMGV
jgi:DNA-binding CsgD family transcriptional regulator